MPTEANTSQGPGIFSSHDQDPHRKDPPNCSEKGQHAFQKWWFEGEPITGFIEAEYKETDQDGNELTWQIKDGNQYVHIQPSEDALLDQWKNQLTNADLYGFKDTTLDSLKPFKWQEAESP